MWVLVHMFIVERTGGLRVGYWLNHELMITISQVNVLFPHQEKKYVYTVIYVNIYNGWAYIVYTHTTKALITFTSYYQKIYLYIYDGRNLITSFSRWVTTALDFYWAESVHFDIVRVTEILFLYKLFFYFSIESS